MAIVAKKYKDNLTRIKQNIEEAHQYFKPNYDCYHDFYKFVFLTSLSEKDLEVLGLLKKPIIECNMLEAYISRLRGEFYKQEPSIAVGADYDYNVNPELLKVVEGHIRHILNTANKDGCEYDVYTDMLAGGFSVLEVMTDYANPMSMKQIIKIDRVFDPTLCGFDPMARQCHKGDGRYCFKLYPKTKDEFTAEFPDIDISEIKFEKDIGGFNWAYRTEKEDILLIADYYEKKKKSIKIVELPNGEVMKDDDYKEMVNNWQDIVPPPAIKDSRHTVIETICRYRLIADQVIEYIETDYKMLPLIFCDGNGVYVREKGSGVLQQHTRPYVYHAKGTQKLKNFAMQSLANELENLVQHKWVAALESIPERKELAEAYTNPQLPGVLTFKAFLDNDVDKPIPPPQAVARTPIPPEVSATIMMSDQITQTILGSYDAALGINDNQLSGKAIKEGATHSNAAAMPYIIRFMQSLTRAAEIILDLIPKYYVTPRSIPVLSADGKKSYYILDNKQGGSGLDYDANALNISVEAGVSFAVQKSRALEQMIALMNASPFFAQFINAVGLDELLSNLEMKGIDGLRAKVQDYMQKVQQQQQQQEQAQAQMMQNNPYVIRAKTEQDKVMLNAQQNQVDNQLKAAEITLKSQELENERLKTISQLKSDERDRVVQLDKHQTEMARAAADMAMQAIDLKHRHTREMHELNHNRAELHRKVADTILKHTKHEGKESPSKETMGND